MLLDKPAVIPDAVKNLLEQKLQQYLNSRFIDDDPISIPHRFSRKQDIEIAGLFAALLAWGNRKAIINSCKKLMTLFENEPYEFILQNNFNNNPELYKKITGFVHRTFNGNDLWFILRFLHHHYAVKKQDSLETAFAENMGAESSNVEIALNGFYNSLFGYDEYARQEVHCRKHIAAPEKKSACKRLNMYLRWMVRKDEVDFGIWKKIQPRQLVIPLDVHVARVAQKLQLLHRRQNDWLAAQQLTETLKQLDSIDPVKYDYALFGLGVYDKYAG